MYADAETGLYYDWHNYYDPRIGRWITADKTSVAQHVQKWRASLGMPSQLPLEINPYVAVANNPLRWTDPTGLGTVPCPPGTSTDPNCTIFDPNTPDTIIDQMKKQNGGMSCATAECAAGVLPNPPPVKLSKCEAACSLAAGKACLYLLDSGPEGIAAYAACEVTVEVACHEGCKKVEQCLAKK